MSAPAGAAPAPRRPLLVRLLRLRHLGLRPWQRAVLGEGVLALSVLLVLADLVSAWALVVLPGLVAAVVKAHDLVAGLLRTPDTPTAPVPRDRRRRGGAVEPGAVEPGAAD